MSTSQNTGCLGSILSALGIGTKQESARSLTYPYGLRDDFLSPAELSLFHVFQDLAGPEQHIVAKVRLSDLFFVRQPHKNQGARNRIDRKHVDFVVCDRKTMQPILAIELDDSSHQRPDRQERDAFVDEVFRAAGLPLLHVPVTRSYDTEALSKQIRDALSEDPPPRQ